MNIFTKKAFDKKAQKRKSPLLFQKGLSLIEASMVLALSAIVVSGVMYYYQAASDNNKTQTTVSEVMSIVSAVNGLYIGTSGYTGLQKSVIYNTSAVPENYKGKNNNEIMHPFGGQIDIGATTDGTKYYIVLNDVPQGPCVNLASMNFGTSLAGAGVGVNATTAQKGTVTPGGTGSGGLTDKALTPAQASTACNKDTNQIAFLLK
ncbi:TPA: pilus assembly protein [Escherichia coli]|uniref:type 4 pilus major pilin n=1 Tax=Escherichia coli TaxID=562 RepID=UPI0018B0807B|nr:type 4 pilus major pilin [Escherichia coli]EEW2749995.1 pilus assembly protein [Escherichia coli]EKY6771648.1 pilus assembly protein [Escherichia coli]ELI2306156.1 pilus assembly protein [Escherichia coli]MBF9750192.1 pilus assembly protein [Escherichia coli]HDC4096025.1 pilus assembly protein [Escherichia coli]